MEPSPELTTVSLLPVILFVAAICAAVVGAFLWGRRQMLKCPKCSEKMEQTSGAEAGEYLSQGERAELNLGSATFLVYHCKCGFSASTRKPNKRSLARSCPGCGFKTLKDAVDGPMAVEVLRRCGNCWFESAEPLGGRDSGVPGVYEGPAGRRARSGAARGSRGEHGTREEGPRQDPKNAAPKVTRPPRSRRR